MSTKDPIAAELGRRGGIKGGKARSKSLSPERRRDIARRAAAARWGSKVVNGVANGSAEGAKVSLPGVATAIRRATLQLGELSFEAFALADGRKLLGLLSVEAALADSGLDAATVAASECGLVSFKEASAWQVSKGVTPTDFLALCRRAGDEVLTAERPAAPHAQKLGRILAILLDCAEEGLERRLTTVLAAN